MHGKPHRSGRIGWLRAATLGANDGLISTSSLVVGMASAKPTHAAVLLAAVAGLVAGALSMAAGEYVSVSSQADTEHADLSLERVELDASPEPEREELAEIYMARGLSRDLAIQVAVQLMAHDALGAHARDEIGILETTRARPIQASVASAASFAVGATPPRAPCVAFTRRGPDAGSRGHDVGPPVCPRWCGCSLWRRLEDTRGVACCFLGCGGHGMYRCSRASIRFRHLARLSQDATYPPFLEGDAKMPSTRAGSIVHHFGFNSGFLFLAVIASAAFGILYFFYAGDSRKTIFESKTKHVCISLATWNITESLTNIDFSCQECHITF